MNKINILLLLYLPFSCLAMEQTHKINFRKETIEIAKVGGIMSGVLTTNVIIHELGHAITGKILFKEPVHIYLGGHGDKIFKTTRYFSIVGPNPFKGYCKIPIDENFERWPKYYAPKVITMTAAGPAAGVLFNYAIIKGVNMFNLYKHYLHENSLLGQPNTKFSCLRHALKDEISRPTQILNPIVSEKTSITKDLIIISSATAIAINLLNLVPMPSSDGGKITVVSIISLLKRFKYF